MFLLNYRDQGYLIFLGKLAGGNPPNCHAAHQQEAECLCSFHPQLFTILKLTKARQRMCSAFSPPSRLVPLLVRAVCQGAELQSSDGSAASLPAISVCSWEARLLQHLLLQACWMPPLWPRVSVNKPGILLRKLKCNSPRLAFVKDGFRQKWAF